MKLGMRDILRALPHRPPMLLIDSVRLLEPSVRIEAAKTLRADDPWFVGHFPGHPVMPGVLIVEALAQAGAVLAAYSPNVEMESHLPYLISIDQARLYRPVRPGQTLELRVMRERAWGRFWCLSGEAGVDGEKVATTVLTAALLPNPTATASQTSSADAQLQTTDIAHVRA